VRAAIADRVVDLAVVTHGEAVEIVAREVVAHAEAAQQLGFLHAARIFFQQPQAWNVGEPHLALAREHARGDAVELGVEPICENAALVGDAVTVGVFDEAHHLAFDREILRLRAEYLPVQGEAILDGSRGQIELEHSHVVADVEHAAAITIRLGDEQPALLVEVEGHGIGQHGLGGPESCFEAIRQREALERERRIFGGRIDDRSRQSLGLVEFESLRGYHRCAGHEQHSETGK
jgi:hypothetical protein